VKIGDTVDVTDDGRILDAVKVCRIYSWKWVKVDLGGGRAEYVRARQCSVTAEAVAEEM